MMPKLAKIKLCNIDDFIKNIFIKPNIKVTTNQLTSNPKNVIFFFILPVSLYFLFKIVFVFRGINNYSFAMGTAITFHLIGRQ